MIIKLSNIGTLINAYSIAPKIKLGQELNQVATVYNACILIQNPNSNERRILYAGPESNCPTDIQYNNEFDLKGAFVTPGFIDSHTHLVFPATREEEFAMRIKGMTYEEIASAGGGILNSAGKTANTSSEQILAQSQKFLQQAIEYGNSAIEIKSGYGLLPNEEIKLLEIANQLKKDAPIEVVTTCLGAHALPTKYKSNRHDFIRLIQEELIPYVAEHKLAEFFDVFCETAYFSTQELSSLLETANQYQLAPKIHTNQFTSIGGLQTAIEHNAVSVDHLEVMTRQDILDLSSSNTIGTLLPACSFYINIPFAPARELIETGAKISLASDFNPGSSFALRLQFTMNLACLKLKMTPEEAFNALTINASHAIKREHSQGAFFPNSKSSIIIWKPEVSSLNYIAYDITNNLVDQVL